MLKWLVVMLNSELDKDVDAQTRQSRQKAYMNYHNHEQKSGKDGSSKKLEEKEHEALGPQNLH